MDRTATSDYSGLPSPYPSNFGDSRSEASLSDPSSAQQYSQAEGRPSGYSASATPTSEYNNGGYPTSARSETFPNHLQHRPYHQSGVGSSMAQPQPTSPSMPLQDGRNHQNPQPDHQQIKSDNDVPIDPSITAPSPTQYAYPPQSPYGQHPDMGHGYGHSGVYAQPRPDWTGYGQPGAPITPGHHVFPQTPTSASTRPNQVGLVASPSRPFYLAGWLELLSSPAASWQPPGTGVFFGERKLMCPSRSTALCQFLAPSSTSDLDEGMRRLSACTSADGTAARRHMVL